VLAPRTRQKTMMHMQKYDVIVVLLRSRIISFQSSKASLSTAKFAKKKDRKSLLYSQPLIPITAALSKSINSKDCGSLTQPAIRSQKSKKSSRRSTRINPAKSILISSSLRCTIVKNFSIKNILNKLSISLIKIKMVGSPLHR